MTLTVMWPSVEKGGGEVWLQNFNKKALRWGTNFNILGSCPKEKVKYFVNIYVIYIIPKQVESFLKMLL